MANLLAAQWFANYGLDLVYLRGSRGWEATESSGDEVSRRTEPDPYHPACSKLKYYASEDADCSESTRFLFSSVRTTLSLSLFAFVLFRERLKGAALSAFS